MSNSNDELKLQLLNCGYVTWKVPNFFSLPAEDDYFLDSPEFQFDGGTWCLRLFPSMFDGDYKDFFVEIWLLRLVSPVPEQSYDCNAGLITSDNREVTFLDQQDTTEEIPFQGQELFGCMFYRERSAVERERCILAPSDTLTVSCRIHPNRMSAMPTSPATKEHTATQTEIDFPSCGMEIPSGEKVRSDYKKLLKSGAESDLLVVVSGREFRAHKCILRARSPFFDAMFEHESAEKKESGKVIIIDDLEPDPFRDFLEYMYTGRVGAFSNENVLGLYTAADKYNVQELKMEAIQYMKRSLCVETFCDVMMLALRHREQELMDCVVNFLKNNVYDILLTVKWQVFMKDNITAANELLIKAHAPEGNKNE